MARPGDLFVVCWEVKNVGTDTTVFPQYIQFIDAATGTRLAREEFALGQGVSLLGTANIRMPQTDLTMRVEAGFGSIRTDQQAVSVAARAEAIPEDQFALAAAAAAALGLIAIGGVIAAQEIQKTQR